MADKSTTAVKFNLANPLPRSMKQTKNTPDEKEKDILLKIVLQNYEDREAKVMSENERLRALLFELYSNVTKSVSKLRGEAELTNLTISNEHFQLPIDTIQHSIEDAVSAGCESLSKLTLSENFNQAEEYKKQLSELMARIGYCIF